MAEICPLAVSLPTLAQSYDFNLIQQEDADTLS